MLHLLIIYSRFSDVTRERGNCRSITRALCVDILNGRTALIMGVYVTREQGSLRITKVLCVNNRNKQRLTKIDQQEKNTVNTRDSII